MSSTKKYTFTKGKRPKTNAEIMRRRFLNAKASLEIEGFQLTNDEVAVFEESIRKGYTLEERTALLKERFPNYDNAIRA